MYYILRALLAFSFFYARLSPVRVAKSALVIVVVIIIMILLFIIISSSRSSIVPYYCTRW